VGGVVKGELKKGNWGLSRPMLRVGLLSLFSFD
jgi:hypothetical protein